MTGYNTLAKAVMDCACQGTGTADGGAAPCATDCKDTFCKKPPANLNATCTTCIDNSLTQNGACIESVSKACSAEADCVAELKCTGGCPK